MNLPPDLLKHKTLMIAILLLARRIAKALKVDPDAPLAEICRAVGASRPSVYEQMERALARITDLAGVGPGRPPTPGDSTTCACESSLNLTIEVLSFRLNHPGSVLPQRGRTSYSPAFQRLILTANDRWQGSLEAFAEAARIPLETLRDWLRHDRAQSMIDPEPTQMPAVPVDASLLVHSIASEWQRWEGPKRSFLAHAARSFRTSAAQVKRVLVILGLITPRRRPPFRHRGETHTLSPGAMLVTDGKMLNVELTASNQLIHLNWQAMVDQTTACDTAAVVTTTECAAGVATAFQRSLVTLGGAAPDALLHDNKPCYDDASLQQTLRDSGTTMIPATPARPENKAVVEGAFGLFEQRVGTIRLDDSSRESLILSAAEEILRAYTAATNSVPRCELDGSSRILVLLDFCPSLDQQQRDRDFLANLKADHDPSRRRQTPPDPSTLDLLDRVFQRLNILALDPKCSLRRFLARFQPSAIRRAAAIVAAKLRRGDIDPKWAHRYLAKVIQSQQHEIDLDLAAHELLHLCELQNQSWTHHEEREHQDLVSKIHEPLQLALAFADLAANGGIPVQSAFWSQKLLALLDSARHLAYDVIKHLVRLYEAPHHKRLALIDLISARHHGIAW